MLRIQSRVVRLFAPALGILMACLGAVSPAQGGNLFDVDINATVGFGVSGTYSGAAVLGAAGDTWNSFTGDFFDSTARTNLALVDSNGASSGVTLSFSGQTGFFDTGNDGVFSPTAFAALMDDYLFVYPPSSVAVTFAGLTAGDAYRLILYSSANAPGRDTIFTVNGSSQTVQDFSAATTFAFGLNYADFTTAADGSGKVSFTVAPGQFGEGNLDGIQLQDVTSRSVPEPSTSVIVSVLIGAFGIRAYTRSKKTVIA
jgi:hypothetical protein